MSMIRRFLFACLALLLSLRYRIRVQGLDQLQDLKGVLIIPQHPAYIDPPIVLRTVYRALAPRPMLFARVFRNPLLFWLPRALNALEIPDLEAHSTQARAQTQQSIDAVIEGLKRGENFILWPSGHVQRQPYESLGAARSLSDIVNAVPTVQLVAVRTRGLWGSSFSFAFTGGQPNLVKALLRGIGVIIANLIFFAPRRTVELTIERFSPADLPGSSREHINPFFERWYNAAGPEKPKFVPYHFALGAREREFPALPSSLPVNLKQVKTETKQAVNQMLAEQLKRELSLDELQPDTTLDKLGLDSLDRMELSLAIEQRFGFHSDRVPTVLGDFWALGAGLVENTPPKPPAPMWFEQPAEASLEILGDTIPQAIVRRALANRKQVIVADDLSGVLTYERLLTGAILLGKRFKKHVPDNPHIGLMLPASVASDVALLGIYLCGKRPIVLNWTTGPGNLAHAAQLTQLTHIITSKKFIDRTGITVAGTQYLFMEDLRQTVSKVEALLTLMKVRYLPGVVQRNTPLVDADSPAVVLFTSGSEKTPKAVPLSHRNIISNIQSALTAFAINRDAVMLGFLPVFHSFGLSVTTLLPLLSGLRCVHHHDPTDAGGLVRKIAMYKPTLLCGTPTFVSYILDRGSSQQLASLKLFVVGAEKCPQALFDRVAEKLPGARVHEGYGITECSPLVSVNTPTQYKLGSIGVPLPGIAVQVVDPDTFTPLPVNDRGMLLVSGPNIFAGYWGDEQTKPFHHAEGKRWYITGDLASIDHEGFIHFAGRLKRFIKAGGEMVSLPALEEPFTLKYPPTEDGPQVAVEGVETLDAEGSAGRKIVLFVTVSMALRDANALLAEHGFRGVMRLDEVRQVERIPVLGTGKTDYKVLRQWVMG